MSLRNRLYATGENNQTITKQYNEGDTIVAWDYLNEIILYSYMCMR